MLHFSRLFVLAFLCMLVIACSSSGKNTTRSSTVYTNTDIGFSLQLPKDWVLPATTEKIAQFSSSNCVDHPSSCSMFTVQDDSAKFDIGPDTTFEQLQNAGLQPIIIDSMIPDATVIAANPGIPSRTFFFAYHVFFPDAQKRLLIQSSDSTLERTVLSTLTILP